MQPMGTLYLIRHGQASFGAADYDRLSELGARANAMRWDSTSPSVACSSRP